MLEFYLAYYDDVPRALVGAVNAEKALDGLREMFLGRPAPAIRVVRAMEANFEDLMRVTILALYSQLHAGQSALAAQRGRH